MARVHVDRDNVNDDTVIVRKLHRQTGDQVQANDVVLEIETSKTVSEIVAPEAGRLTLAVKQDDEVPLGALLFEVGAAQAAPAPAPAPAAAAAMPTSPAAGEPAAQETASGASAKFSNKARAALQRMGLSEVAFTGKGWVTEADVLGPRETATKAAPAQAAAPRTAVGSNPPATPAAAAADLPSQAAFRAERASMRKRSESKVLSLANASGTTSTIAIELPLPGPRIVPAPFLFQGGIADLVVFEGSRLLKAYPELNAFYIDEKTRGHYEAVHFGISYDADRNLKVLAIREAQSLALPQIQTEFERLLHLYESGQAIPEPILAGATITLSDLSKTGASSMFPLVNGRQSLILGLTQGQPGVFTVHASFDHRVAEGLLVARFLESLKERVLSYFGDAMAEEKSLACSACQRSLQEEIRAGNRGLVRMATAGGKEGYLCRNCFAGW